MSEQTDVPVSETLVVTRRWWQSLWLWLLVLGIALYILVYWYQSGSAVRDIDYQHHIVDTFTDDADILTLDVLYPQILRLEPRSAPTQTVTIALWYTATPTYARSYTVNLSIPITPVIATDHMGNRIVPRFVITPDIGEATPIAFHIRQVPLLESIPAQIIPSLQIQSSSGGAWEFQDKSRPMLLEQPSSARWRQFWSLIFAPTTPLLIGAAGLVGFAVQEIRDWARRVQDERKRTVLTVIQSLTALLRTDPSEAARCYLASRGQLGVMWGGGQIQRRLEDAWRGAPAQLRHTVELLTELTSEARFYEKVERIGVQTSIAALEWAIESLDDEWQQQASNGLALLSKHPEHRKCVSGQVLQNVEQRHWHAILQAWPHLSFWRDLPLSVDPEIAKGLDCLYSGSSDKRGISFGSEEAETDTLLLRCAVDFPWLQELHEPRPAICIGIRGSGKTATALLLARGSLREQDAFPVYFPASPDDLQLDRVTQALVKTLLHYLAVTPAGFLKCGVAGRTTMAHLLARYMRPNLPLYFHQAGLPKTGDGVKMLQEIEALVRDASFQESLTGEELLSLLSEARPHGFQYTMLLLDVQEQTGRGKGIVLEQCLQSLLDLADRLARVGVFTKAFLPDAFRKLSHKREERPPLRWMELQWSDDDLSALLRARLAQFDEETLAAWCDPEVKSLSPDARLVRAAQGTPRRLICKGNELLRHIGKTQRLLTADDLNKILGR